MESTNNNDARAQRGARIAACGGVTRTGPESWRVCSQTKGGAHYVVRLIPGGVSCTCPDHQEVQIKCKHIWAAEIAASADGAGSSGTGRMAGPATGLAVGPVHSSGRSVGNAAVEPAPEPKKERPTYSQNWSLYNRAQTQEKAIFERLVRDLCDGIPQPVQTSGRRRLLLGDVIGAALAKVYAMSSGRRFMTPTHELVEKGVLTSSPHYNSVFRYLGDPALTPILKSLIERTSAPLKALETQFAQDGSGFSTHTYRRYFDHRNEKKTKAEFVRAQVFAGTVTKVAVWVEVFTGRGKGTGESPHLLPMAARAVTNGWNVKEVSADKAYGSQQNRHGLAAMGVQAFIPFKENEGPNGTPVWDKAFHLFNLEKEEFLLRYHRRSNVETVFSMVQRKFGTYVRAKLPVAQINEVFLKFVCHNICCLVSAIIEFGLEPRLSGKEVK